MKAVVGALLLTSAALHGQEPTKAIPWQSATSYCATTMDSPRVAATGPTLVYRVSPRYPKEARRAKLEGDVHLSATVGTDGLVKDVRVISGEPALADAAVAAVRQWRYEPAVTDGAPVEVPTEITVNFTLAGHGKRQGPGQSADSADQAASATPPATTEEGSPEQVYAVEDGVKPPQAVYSPEPSYTESARKAGVQGTVLLAVVVNSEGNVRDVEVCRRLDPALDLQATRTVSQWKFQPATKDGQPVAVHIPVEVSFHLYR